MARKQYEFKEDNHKIALAEYINRVYGKGLPYKIENDHVKFSWKRAETQVKLKWIGGDNFTWPDFFTPYPSPHYHGLWIELKDSYETLFNKKGQLRKGEQIQKELYAIKRLRDFGFWAAFSWDIDVSIGLIKAYLAGRNFETKPNMSNFKKLRLIP
jgi:hypothetical protein